MVKEVNPNKARQGRQGWQVLVVLVVALILLMIGWWAVELYGSAIAPEDPAGDAALEEPTQPAAPGG